MTPTGPHAVSDVVPEVPGRRAIPLARIRFGLAALVLIGREAAGYVPRFARWVDGLGPSGPAGAVVGYAVAVVADTAGLIGLLVASTETTQRT